MKKISLLCCFTDQYTSCIIALKFHKDPFRGVDDIYSKKMLLQNMPLPYRRRSTSIWPDCGCI